MSIKIAEAHIRCKICKEYRAQRYCPRTGKDICWVCCNSKRIDQKCPAECAYILQTEDNASLDSSVKKTKVDSLKELTDITIRLFDYWCEMPVPNFGGKIPSEMSRTEEGREELKSFLSSIEDILILPEGYLKKKLKIDLRTKLDSEENYEAVAGKYLKKLMTHDWEGSIEYLYNQAKYKDELYRNNYLRRRAENNLMNTISSFDLLLSAISENGKEALTFFEINKKYDLSMILGYENNRWSLKEVIIGSPSFYYGEREAIVLISGFISQQEMEKAKEYLDQYKEILIDSADFHYLKGLYHLLTKDYHIALRHYLTAVELDPDFYEYKYNLALIYQMLESYEMAKRLYLEMIGQKSDDINVLNNLAVIYEAEGNLKDALELLEKCLQYDSNAEIVGKNIQRIKDKLSKKKK